MPRPKRRRRIMARPQVESFGPASSDAGGEIILSLEEFEAIRLIDYDGKDQSQTAGVMGVSRQTVGRILKAGRSKVSTALVEGLILRMSGGCYKIRGQGQSPGRGPDGKPGRGRGFGRGRGAGSGYGAGPVQYTDTRTALQERARILEDELKAIKDQLTIMSDKK